MKIWTYLEMKTKIEADLDLAEETFIPANEMAGYFNEGLTEAETEIMDLNKDYFLSKYYVPLTLGGSQFDLPDNIFANKIRNIVYANGSIIYDVRQYRRKEKFLDMAFTDLYGSPDDYRYLLVNHYPGQAVLEIHPVSREAAILPPSASASTPMVMWYYRNCARVPLTGEYCNPEVLNPTQVNTGTSVITVNSGTTTYGVKNLGIIGCFPGSIAYVTGDAVKFKAGPGGTLPSPLVAGTVYYVIAQSATTIKLATTLANALAGTAITLTTQGTIFHTMYVAATTAIMNATLIDIPEFSTFVMQWVKCSCLPKEGDPRLDFETKKLVEQKEAMINSLVNNIVDDDDTIQPDLTHYAEHS